MRYNMKLSKLDELFDFRSITINACQSSSLSRLAIKIPTGEIHDVLHDHGLKIVYAAVFHTPPKSFLPIHIDGNLFEDVTKLNFIYGASESSMIWYRLRDDLEQDQVQRRGLNEALPYMPFKSSDCIRVHSAKVQGANLLVAGEPHSVFNPTNEHRWCLTFSLRKTDGSRPNFEELCDQLKDLE